MKNIVLLTIDALRRDRLGCYGCPRGLTPFLDGLADRGLIFTNAHAVAPYTQASFPGILTSSLYFDYADSRRLSGKRTLISEALSRAGICTAAFHSNPYLGSYFGWDRGWARFYDSMHEEVDPKSPYISGDKINTKVSEWLGSRDPEERKKRLFLWIHYMDIHEPYVPRAQTLARIDPALQMSRDEMFVLFKDVVIPRDTSDSRKVDVLATLYDAHVLEVDGYVRDLFGILEAHGVLDDGALIATADHGDEFAEHGALSHNGKMYGELLDVPVILWGAIGSEQHSSDRLVSGLDISPTILHLFGLKPEPAFQGGSLLPLSTHERVGCYAEAVGKLEHKTMETDRPIFSYIEKGAKVIYRAEGQSWEMYDLNADPGEKRNVVEDHPRAGDMKSKLAPRIDRGKSG